MIFRFEKYPGQDFGRGVWTDDAGNKYEDPSTYAVYPPKPLS